MKPGICDNCNQRRWIQARGLCQRCNRRPEVRALHRPSRGPGSAVSDPTAAELDALIAEQMAKLPAWWATEEAEKLTAAIPPPGEPRVAALGRGLKRD